MCGFYAGLHNSRKMFIEIVKNAYLVYMQIIEKGNNLANSYTGLQIMHLKTIELTLKLIFVFFFIIAFISIKIHFQISNHKYRIEKIKKQKC